MAKGNAKEVLRTLLITQGQLCSNLGFRFQIGTSMLGVSLNSWPTVPQLQIHPSVLCFVMLGPGFCRLCVPFVSSFPIGVLQMGPYHTCSFQCQPTSNLAAAVGFSIQLLSVIPQQFQGISSEVQHQPGNTAPSSEASLTGPLGAPEVPACFGCLSLGGV